MTPSDKILVAAILQAIASALAVLCICITRMIRRSTQGPPPWELVALSMPDVMGVIITLVACYYNSTVIPIAGVQVLMFPCLITVLVVFIIVSFLSAFNIMMQAALTHNRTVKGLYAAPVFTRDQSRRANSNNKKSNNTASGNTNKLYRSSRSGNDGEVKLRSELIPLHIILAKSTLISFLSVFAWGISRNKFIQRRLGRMDSLTTDWVCRSSIVCALVRALFFSLIVVMTMDSVLTPGVNLSVCICLAVTLMSIGLESSHGNRGTDFIESFTGGKTIRVDQYRGGVSRPSSRHSTTLAARFEIELQGRADEDWTKAAAAVNSDLEKVYTALGFGVGGSLKNLLGGDPAESSDVMFDRKRFVGRTEELKTIVEGARGCCAHGTEPTGRTFLITGEMGIGKTCFIEALKTDLSEFRPKFGSYTVWNRTCLPTMSALGCALRSLMDSLGLKPSRLSTVARSMPEQFRNLLPLLGLILPELSTPETDASRVRMCSKVLFNSLAEVITSVIQSWKTDNGLTVLIVENIQCCDEFSLEVLNRLPQCASKIKLPLLLILTARIGLQCADKDRQIPGDSASSNPKDPNRTTTAICLSILSNPLTTQISLSRLSELEGAQIIESRTEIAPYIDNTIAAKVAQNAKGLPIDIWYWSKLIQNTASKITRCHAPPGRDELNSKIHGAVMAAVKIESGIAERSLQSYEPEVQEFLAIVSALGPEMHLEAMYYLFKKMIEGETSTSRFISIIKSLQEKKILFRGTRIPIASKRYSLQRGNTQISTTNRASASQLVVGGLQRGYTSSSDPLAASGFSEDGVLVWSNESLMETSYRSLIATKRVEVHRMIVRYLITKLNKQQDRLADVESHLEIAHHLEKSSERWMAVFFYVLAVQQGMRGEPFLIRLDILLYADSFSFRQKPSGPVDLPSPPLEVDANRDVLHGTIEYLFALSGSTTDDVTSSKLIWCHGSECIGRFIDAPKQLPELGWFAQSTVFMATLKQRIRPRRYQMGSARNAGIMLYKLTPLIGLNLDASTNRAMQHFFTAVNLLEEHGGSVDELLVGYAWLQHHLAFAKHFGVREKVIKKGRTLIASMDQDEISRKRMSVAFFEGMIGMGFSIAGSFIQAEAFLISATVLADVLVISFPLSNLYVWHAVSFIEAGRILEAAKLIFLARQRLLNDEAADYLTIRLLDTLYIYLSIVIGYGSKDSPKPNPGIIAQAEDLITKTLESLRPSTGIADKPPMASASGRGTPPPAKLVQADSSMRVSALPAYTSSESVAFLTSATSFESVTETELRQQMANRPATIYGRQKKYEKILNPSTPQTMLMISILSLVAYHIENHEASAKLIDHLLFPASNINAAQQSRTLSKHQQQGHQIAPTNSSTLQTSPLACAWVPTSPFAIARAAETTVRALISLQKPPPQTHTHNSGLRPPPLQDTKRDEWRFRARCALQHLCSAATKVPHLQAENHLMSLVVKFADSNYCGVATAATRAKQVLEIARDLGRARDAARAHQRVFVEAQIHAQAALMLGDSPIGKAKFITGSFEDWRLFEEECGARVMTYNCGAAAQDGDGKVSPAPV